MIKRVLRTLGLVGLFLLLCATAIAEEPLIGTDFVLFDAYLPVEGADETLLVRGVHMDDDDLAVAILALDGKGEGIWRVAAQGAMAGETIYSVVPLSGGAGLITGREPDPQWMNITKDGVQTQRWMLPAVTSGVYEVADGLLVFYRESNKAHSPRSLALYDIEGNQLWTKSHNLNWYIHGAMETAEGYVAWGDYSEEVNADSLGYVVMFDRQGEVLWQSKLSKIRSLKYAIPQADGSVVVASNYIYKDGKPSVARFAKVSEGGILWEREQAFGEEGMPVNGALGSIVAAGDGFCAASAEVGVAYGAKMWALDTDGNLIESWVEDTPGAYRPSQMLLIPHEGGMKLLYQGFGGQGLPEENDSQPTYWKDVDIAR